MEPILLDLNQLLPGKPDVAGVTAKVRALDPSPYANRVVQLKGCSPSWVHLMVAARLLPGVAGLDFLMDDGKGGQAIPVYRRD